MKRTVRRLLVFVTTGSLLALTPVPSAQAASLIVIDGFNYPGAIHNVADPCPGGAAPIFAPLYRSGGSRGSHATGRAFGGTTGGMAGFEADLPTPRSLQSVTLATYQPAPATNETDGYLIAAYDPSANEFAGNRYFGVVSLNGTASGWGYWTNLAAVAYSWSFGDPQGTSQPAVFTGTIAELANAVGANGSGAKLAFELGCDGRDYFMDDLQVSTSAGTTIFDFEGARSRSYISANSTHHSDSLTRDITRLNLVYGQGHYLLGDGTGISDGVQATEYIDGTARLYRKAYGHAAYRWAGTKAYEADTYAAFRIEPGRQTRYQLRTLSTSIHEASTSKTLLVTVKRRLRVRAADTTIRRGQRIILSGYILPRDRGVTVRLQRLVNGRWRSLATAKTARKGRFSVSVRASTVGKKRVRVKVSTAQGNVGTVSPRITVTVKRAPAPAATPYYPPIPPAPHVDPPDHDPDDIKARYVFNAISGDGAAFAAGRPRSSATWSSSATITQTDD